MDYLVYAYLQLAQDKEASRRRRRESRQRGHDPDVRTGPLRGRGTRRATWWSAATGRVPRTWRSADPFADVDAILILPARWARLTPASPRPPSADIAKLVELRDKLRQAKDNYWTEQVDIQWQIATAWVLYAEGQQDEAIKAMSAAADAEDNTEKAPLRPVRWRRHVNLWLDAA